jgi:crotonobetainyl-CoA:carnitine CoA-transferase CaiB-like acyl-CoA transferase
VLLEKQFESLMRVLGRPDVLSDPRFASWPLRSANSAALREIIEGAMREGDPAGWEARLTAADVPCGSILGLDETVNHPQVRHRGQLQTVGSPFGPMTLVGPGFQLAHGGGGVARAPGRIGEHTDEILDEFGFAPSEVERWRQMRVI